MAKKMMRIYGDYPELKGVPLAIQRQAMPEILKEGKAIAQKEAPKRRGYSSRKSIVSRISTGLEKQDAVGHIRSRAPHSHLIEFGTAGHSLASGEGRSKKKPGKAMTIMGDPDIIRRGAWTVGIAPNPFMERTEEQLPPVVDKVLMKIGTQVLQDSIKDVSGLLGGLTE